MEKDEQSLRTIRKEVKEISVIEVQRLLVDRNHRACLIDTREQNELVTGYIKDSLFIPDSTIKSKVQERLPDKTVPLILYCSEGIRSLYTAKVLKEMGYEDVCSMSGGLLAWAESGYDMESHGEFTADQIRRYSRQMILREIGEEGQLKILQAKVLLVGAGGLGCPIGLYLGAAGIGTIGIVDSDTVDMSNIHRQVLHGTADVGRPKVESARDAIIRINPEVHVLTYNERFTPENALSIVNDYDMVVDGSDNFSTKFLLNDTAFFAGKPYIFGGAVRFDGQAGVFFPKAGGPCLRCMTPEIPPHAPPTCSDVGVLGLVPGHVGLTQATEVIKLIINKGTSLMGRFFVYDALHAEFRVFTISRNPACPLCGENPTIKSLKDRDYGFVCS
jgi:molybdopterin/thiamine biosynthesis adenylyltransferase/rhodanese-related sulfurtransferase